MRLLRLLKILAVGFHYRLDEFFPFHLRFLRAPDEPRGARLRRALEALGPIFVKFGQVLSTRRDLLPPDIADELAKLQDRVPPFDSKLVRQTIERGYQRRIED